MGPSTDTSNATQESTGAKKGMRTSTGAAPVG